MRKRTVKLWRLHEDGRKLFAGTIEAADPRELVLKWSAFLATAERGTYFATYRGSFVGPEPAHRTSHSRSRASPLRQPIDEIDPNKEVVLDNEDVALRCHCFLAGLRGVRGGFHRSTRVGKARS
jgi:hypothetical protein